MGVRANLKNKPFQTFNNHFYYIFQYLFNTKIFQQLIFIFINEYLSACQDFTKIDELLGGG